MTKVTDLTWAQMRQLEARQPGYSYNFESHLSQLGAVPYDLLLPESHVVPMIIHPDEPIEGLVYGRYAQDLPTGQFKGRGVLVATSQRVLLVDSKPLYVRCAETSYDIVSGITYSRVWFGGTVTLHTRMGNILVRTLNNTCAHGFVEAIEAHIFSDRRLSIYT